MNRSEAGKLGRAKAETLLRKKWATLKNTYDSNPKKCNHCNEPILYKNRLNTFCNKSCAAIFNNPLRVNYEIRCITCDKDITNKYFKEAKYCSRHCCKIHKYKIYIEHWKKGRTIEVVKTVPNPVRKYILDKYGNKCARCGWAEINPTTNKVPVQIDHIDGNWKNNSEHNLILLCPNCHSLTSTFGGLNRGHGRKHRYKTP